MDYCIINSVVLAHLKILHHLHYVLCLILQQKVLEDIGVFVSVLLGRTHNAHVTLNNTIIN